MTRPATEAPRQLPLDGRTWMQVQVAARRLKVTAGRIYHLVADGRLQAREHLGLIYVEEESLKRYGRYQRQLHHLRTKMTAIG